MTAVKATFRKGRLELNEPFAFPDGAEVLISLQGSRDDLEGETLSPEEIARILKLMDETPPMKMTDEEIARWEEDLKKMNELELIDQEKTQAELASQWK